jgi:hypothetical protein
MPQLDVTTFYLQATTVWFAFMFTQALTTTYIIPRISISLFVREALAVELEEFLELDSFKQFKYLNLNISTLASFLETNILLTKTMFYNTLCSSVFKEIFTVSSNFENEILQTVKQKIEFLNNVKKIKLN